MTSKVTKLKTPALGFQIESGVTMPERKKTNPYASVFSKMKIGDSFLVGHDHAEVNKVKYYAKPYGQETDRTFAFRTTSEGVRCWRVK